MSQPTSLHASLTLILSKVLSSPECRQLFKISIEQIRLYLGPFLLHLLSKYNPAVCMFAFQMLFLNLALAGFSKESNLQSSRGNGATGTQSKQAWRFTRRWPLTAGWPLWPPSCWPRERRGKKFKAQLSVRDSFVWATIARSGDTSPAAWTPSSLKQNQDMLCSFTEAPNCRKSLERKVFVCLRDVIYSLVVSTGYQPCARTSVVAAHGICSVATEEQP